MKLITMTAESLLDEALRLHDAALHAGEMPVVFQLTPQEHHCLQQARGLVPCSPLALGLPDRLFHVPVRVVPA